jgi:hypothetical protein
VVERGHGGDPVAHGRRRAHDVRGGQVGVHELRPVGAQLRGGARYGPRVEAGQAELDDRDAVAAQGAHPGGVGRGRERDDDDLHAGVGRGARQVDEADLRGLRVQGRDEVRDLHAALPSGRRMRTVTG